MRARITKSSLVCGHGPDGGTETKICVGSRRNTLSGTGPRTGLSSEKSTTTKGSRTKCGYCWLVTRPSNDMSRSSAKRTLTIPPLKPTLKNEKDFTCGKHFGALVHFAISGTSSAGSARSAIHQSRGLRDGACTIASPLCWVGQRVPKTASYFIQSALTRFTARIFLYRSRVSLKEAFEGLEPCDRETITHGS